MNHRTDDPRDHLVEVGRSVVHAGLVVGSGGNLSARIAGTNDLWVTGAGTWLDRLDRASFVRVRLDGGLVGDDADASPPTNPTTELPLHLATYEVRPDVNAIVHLHPQTVVLVDALGESVRLITTDHAYYLRRVVSTPFRLPGTAELAEVAANATIDGTNCVILAQHGCSVLADSVELAHKRALYLEEAARLTYRALALGRLAELPDCPPEFLARLDDPSSAV